MNNLKFLREQRNLTQGELASKSELSLRTIQRIEAGNNPKGFTLNALVNALQISSTELFPQIEQQISVARAKQINFSALLGIIIPFGSIIFPMILTYKTKDEYNKHLGKSIICVQIILVAILSLLMIVSPFIQKVVNTKIPIFIFPLLAFIVVKVYIIIKNGISLNRTNDLSIKLNTNFL